ncbi:MAG: DNA polymerase III subunit delta, partial [Candidatus Acetothermia bacterium]
AKSKIVHLRHAQEIKDIEGLASILEKVSLKEVCLLIEADSISKNSRLFRAAKEKGTVEKFDQITNRNLPKYIAKNLKQHGVSLNREARRWFIQVMDPDLHHLHNEIEKLNRYQNGEPLSLEEVKSIVWAKGQGKIFDYLDSFFAREISQSLRTLSELLNREVPESKIFFMLAGEARLMLQVKSLANVESLSSKEIASKTGKAKWLISKKMDLIDNFTTEELRSLLHALHRCDQGVKGGRKELKDCLYQLTFSYTRLPQATTR